MHARILKGQTYVASCEWFRMTAPVLVASPHVGPSIEILLLDGRYGSLHTMVKLM
jgi:hypothetical protein